MALEYFCCFYSYREKLSALTDEQIGRVFRAAMLYAETGELIDLEPLEALAFGFIKFDIDNSREKYEERCRKNRANGGIRRQSQPNACETTESKTESKTETKTETKSKTYKECDTADKPPKARARPSSVDEVRAYCEERKNNVDPQRFVDFYDSNGWVQGKGKPIRDWKAAVRTWENRGTSDTNATKNQESDGWAYITAVGKGEIL